MRYDQLRPYEQGINMTLLDTYIKRLKTQIPDLGENPIRDRRTFLVFKSGNPVGWIYNGKRFDD